MEEKGREQEVEDREEEEEAEGMQRKEEEEKKGITVFSQPTWDPCDSSVQAGSSCSDLVGPSLSQGPHS